MFAITICFLLALETPVEEALAASVHLIDAIDVRLVDTVHNTRDTDEEGRLENIDFSDKFFGISREETDTDAKSHADVLGETLEDVGEWEVGVISVVRGEHIESGHETSSDSRNKVFVVENNTLGGTSCTGGVHNREDIVRSGAN